MKGKGRSHRDAGIRTSVSEPVYPAEIMAEPGWSLGSNALRGAWAHTLLEMWRERTPTIERSVTQWARAWNVSEMEALRIIEEMEAPPNVCKVRRCACRDLVAPVVALTCRRLERRHKVLKQKASAKREERAAKGVSAICRVDVAKVVGVVSDPPSSPSSSPPSSPPSSSDGGDESKPPIKTDAEAPPIEEPKGRKPPVQTEVADRDFSVDQPTLAECIATAMAVGLKSHELERMMRHYQARGWLLPGGLPVRDLRALMGSWKDRRREFEVKEQATSRAQALRLLEEELSAFGARNPHADRWTPEQRSRREWLMAQIQEMKDAMKPQMESVA